MIKIMPITTWFPLLADLQTPNSLLLEKRPDEMFLGKFLPPIKGIHKIKGGFHLQLCRVLDSETTLFKSTLCVVLPDDEHMEVSRIITGLFFFPFKSDLQRIFTQ